MRRKLLHRRGGKTPASEPEQDSQPVIDLPPAPSGMDPATIEGAAAVVGPISAFDQILSNELEAPTVVEPVVLAPKIVPDPSAVVSSRALEDLPVDQWFESGPDGLHLGVDPEAAPSLMPRYVAGIHELGFWDRFDEVTAAAELFAVPPAAITAVVGSLHVAVDVARRCRASHWVSDCDVFVLTQRPEIIGEPTWTTLRRPSDVVALLEGAQSDFPLIVVDIPRELPAWVRPLLDRLRASGIGLVHYVLDNSPSDEDLATWHGELGRPSVLDLAGTVEPGRVLELLDRGEPIASVGGKPITADLLLALRLTTAADGSSASAVLSGRGAQSGYR